MPPADQVERVDEYNAVALFVQSARRVQAGFVLRAEEGPAVAVVFSRSGPSWLFSFEYGVTGVWESVELAA